MCTFPLHLPKQVAKKLSVNRISSSINHQLSQKQCSIMAHLHCQRQTWVQTQIQIPNPMATLHYAEYFHIACTWIQIPTPHCCTGQDSESESVPESVSSNVNESLDICDPNSHPYHNDDETEEYDDRLEHVRPDDSLHASL